jgi:hypothetical protein
MNKPELLTYVAGLRLTDLQLSNLDQDKFVCFSTPGSHAEAAWRLLRNHVDTTLHWPVIIGAETSRRSDIDNALEQILDDSAPEPAETIKEAMAKDPHKWLVERIEALEIEDLPPPSQRPQLSLVSSTAPTIRPYSWSSVRNILTRNFADRVHIMLVPTAIPWEVAAYLNWGGWNDCPMPAEHVIMHRYWHEQWHAEPFAMTSDIIELHVRKPPSASQSLAVAREQYAYAPDIVDQGTDTVEALAKTIANSDGWFFWWD